MVVALPGCSLLWAAQTSVLGTSICLRCGLREPGPQEGIGEGGELYTQAMSALRRVCGVCGVQSSLQLDHMGQLLWAGS